MSLITVELKDGTRRQVEAGSTWGQVAAGIGGKLGKEALAARVGGEIEDLQSPAEADRQVEFLVFGDEEGRVVFRHTSSHVGPGGAAALPGDEAGHRPRHRRRLLLRPGLGPRLHHRRPGGN